MAVHEFDRLRQVALEDQNVVGQVEVPQRADPGLKILAQHVRRVRLVLQHVADGNELGVCSEFFQGRGQRR